MTVELHLEVGDEDVVAQRYDEAVPVATLEPHPLNPNRGDIPFIQESIEAHGFYGAVLVQEGTNRIIAGEHRWRAAIATGMTAIPVFYKAVDDAEAISIMLVDNESARRSRNDEQALEMCLSELQDLRDDEPFAGTGFTLRDLQQIEENRRLRDPTDEEFGDRYGIIIECDDEQEQRRIFQQLTELGYENLRVIAV